MRGVLTANGAAILAMVVAWRSVDDTAFHLVQSWYEPVLYLTAAVLVVLAVWAGLPLMRSAEPVAASWSWRGVGVVATSALPIVLLVAFEPRPLGSASIERTASDDSFLANLAASGREPGQRNLFQWAIAFRTENPANLAGQSVDIVAFVHHPEEQSTGTFMAARFVVACCIADARGVALPVDWPGGEKLPRDSWVRVEGEVGLAANGEPFIRARTVTTIDAPSNPYLYP